MPLVCRWIIERGQLSEIEQREIAESLFERDTRRDEIRDAIKLEEERRRPLSKACTPKGVALRAKKAKASLQSRIDVMLNCSIIIEVNYGWMSECGFDFVFFGFSHYHR